MNLNLETKIVWFSSIPKILIFLARVKQITDQYRLVGHTINNDLEALKLNPKNEIVDIGDLIELQNRYKKAIGHDTGNERIG